MTFLQPGEFAPDFVCASSINPEFSFNTIGGYRVALCFVGGLSQADGAAILAAFPGASGRLRARFARLILVSSDPADVDGEVAAKLTAMNLVSFWDGAGDVARRFGVAGWRGTVILDFNMRFFAAIPLTAGTSHLDEVAAAIDAMPSPRAAHLVRHQAPVLIVPDVFPVGLCRRLIDYFEASGGRPSGYMDEKAGLTIGVLNPRVKTRTDVTIADETLRQEILHLLSKRVRPEVRKAFASDFTYVERQIVARYDAESQGHFSAHRDNTTTGTAHRKFAATINLNAEAYEGGDLRFPEYGRDTYRAPTGGAVVFACGLMHEALPVTSGRRYAFLPFFYDQAGRRQREVTRGSIIST